MRKLLIYVAAIAIAVWIFGSGRERPPSPQVARDKAYLCSLASDLHAAQIERARARGLVVEDGIDSEGRYVFTVDEAMWREMLADEQEVVAIAGWCRVASEDGEGVALIVSRGDKNEIASVVNGQFHWNEGDSDFE